MDSINKRDLQVINYDMIARSLEDQGLKGEIGKLTRKEGITWNEARHIRLEFMNILKIDHLWVLPSLTMLSLSNNLIEHIENLEMLVNLKGLDLSFNKIKKIENLDQLIKLETLNLFNNFVNKLENMDKLTQLHIFSIGNNKIDNEDNILYLRRFKKLKSFNLAGNPCIKDATAFRIFVATFLPNIVYYEYKMIEEVERQEGKTIHIEKLDNLEKEEISIIKRESRLAADQAEAILHDESFVEFLGSTHLYQEMFNRDIEGNALLKLGDEVKEFYNEYEIIFLNLCRKIFQHGQNMYEIRKVEVEQFFTITESAKIKNQEKSINHMESFMSLKVELFKQIKTDKDALAKNTISKEQYTDKCLECRNKYYDKIHKTWKILMCIEITLFEQLEETNEHFEQTLREMINNFIEMSQGYFAQMRTAQQTYNEQVIEMTLRYMTMNNIASDNVITQDIAPIFVDRRTLMNAIYKSHLLHLNAIDNREDRLISRANIWLSNMVNNLQRNEIIRNRGKILEINHYLDIQKEEFEDIIISPDI